MARWQGIRDRARDLVRHRSPVVVPLLEQQPTRHALDVACRLAADRGTSVLLVAPLFVELELPLDAHFDQEEAALRAELAREQAVAESYGIPTHGRIVRARHGQLGPGLAATAEEMQAVLIVIGAPIESRRGFRRPFSRDVWSVLHEARCPVLIASPRKQPGARAAA